jgi:hypothetical protein
MAKWLTSRSTALDLLKLDCEGAQCDILPSAEAVLTRVRLTAIGVSLRAWQAVEKLATWLRNRGYVVDIPKALRWDCWRLVASDIIRVS